MAGAMAALICGIVISSRDRRRRIEHVRTLNNSIAIRCDDDERERHIRCDDDLCSVCHHHAIDSDRAGAGGTTDTNTVRPIEHRLRYPTPTPLTSLRTCSPKSRGSCDVVLVDPTPIQGNGFGWYHVQWNGIDGWTAKSNTR